mmetsp:Transcript_9931/g.32402  ORF Transcript_9931/g.32402 Transcript_9931/m.32402 type:complete len:259 (+) Transcript_9931:1049-1825(+)
MSSTSRLRSALSSRATTCWRNCRAMLRKRSSRAMPVIIASFGKPSVSPWRMSSCRTTTLAAAARTERWAKRTASHRCSRPAPSSGSWRRASATANSKDVSLKEGFCARVTTRRVSTVFSVVGPKNRSGPPQSRPKKPVSRRPSSKAKSCAFGAHRRKESSAAPRIAFISRGTSSEPSSSPPKRDENRRSIFFGGFFDSDSGGCGLARNLAFCLDFFFVVVVKVDAESSSSTSPSSSSSSEAAPVKSSSLLPSSASSSS